MKMPEKYLDKKKEQRVITLREIGLPLRQIAHRIGVAMTVTSRTLPRYQHSEFFQKGQGRWRLTTVQDDLKIILVAL